MTRPTSSIRIPAAPLSAGVPLPAVCVRHGEPTVVTRPMTFLSKTPTWVWLFIFFTILVPIVLTLVLRKRVKAAAIPVCDQCLADRSLRLRMMTAALVATAVLIPAALVIPNSALLAVVGVLAFIVAPFAALLAGTQTRWGFLMGAQVEQDGLWVQIKSPAPAFAEAYALLAAPPVVSA